MGDIIQMFLKPLDKKKFDSLEDARIISIKQNNCSHHLEIDEELDNHNCCECGKLFTSHEALLFVLHNRQTKLSSYSLRNEIHFLTEKKEFLIAEIEFLKKDKRLVVKLNKLENKE